MSVVTEHLEQRGAAFEVLPHRQAYTSIDEARALGVDADEVLKTLAVRTGPGYVLVVIPDARRLDLQPVREALDDNHARLATALFGTGGITTVALTKRPQRGSDEPVA